MKAALGGYGARLSRPAAGIHDSVRVKGLALSQGERRFVVVTADVLGFPHKFKEAVLARLAAEGWTSDQVMLLPSHSHTSIDLMAIHPDNNFGIPQVGVFQGALFEWTTLRVAQAIREAARGLAPVRVGSATVAVADRNRNRRGGPAHDPGLVVTRVDLAGGGPLAVLVNWTAHPTFMGESDMLFSGDWPGHLQRMVEALVGQGVVVLYYNGAEGDQSPVPPAEGGSGWERAERYGREMGLKVHAAWGGITPGAAPTFRAVTIPIELPRRQWHPDFMKTGGAEYGLSEDRMQVFVDRLLPTETRITALQLADLLVVGAPGELAAELGMNVKAEARRLTGIPNVAIGGLANEWLSYILQPSEYHRGGYEASMSFYGEGLGARVVEGMVRAAGEIAKPPR